MLADLAALAVDELELRREAAERGRAEAVLRAAIDNLPLHFWMRDREHRCVLQSPVARARTATSPAPRPSSPACRRRWSRAGAKKAAVRSLARPFAGR